MTGEPARFLTRAALAGDLRSLGVGPGDVVMVHASVSSVGPLLNGPDDLVRALLDAAGPGGTVLAYTDWPARYPEIVDDTGRVRPEWRDHVAAFDAERSRSIRDHGVLPEYVRTTPGACRSGNPGASVAAIGEKAGWITAGHPLDYGYGEGSPFARLVEAGGKVAMIGAPLDTMTLLHHAEHLADLRGKRVVRAEVPLATSSGTEWRMIEEFDTSNPVVEGLADDYFAEIVSAFLNGGGGRRGMVGRSESVLVPAAGIVAFAVAWLEARFR